ncbi:UDP-glycosyltransferase 86A1-like [Andrographis paniculata]|uniref:UDP-glycosyltransferase 86A1-like n=1 Tax=Andrographis paniculata TaxID=175694 RepID=UPI001E701559|nr:UDP-glycosyltransferase 86A1-like [Andrographis paniculata]QZJ84690.1 UDP-glycosyltransferase 19 [Andrographis paniculata]
MVSKGKLHAILFPIPHPGHINPSINFALKLALRGFVVTYVNLEFVHHQLKSKSQATEDIDIFSEARKSGLDIRHTTVSDGLPLEFNRVFHLEDYWEHMLVNFPAHADEVVGRIIHADPYLLHFLVADTFYGWSATVANKYNIANVSFWTEPALVYSLIRHSELLRENGHFPCKDNVAEEITYIPGIKTVHTKDFMPYLKESDVETTSYKLVFTAFKEESKADFVLHNTVYELESETLSGLSKYKPHYAIGPINFSKGLPTNTVSKSLNPETDCSQWLASKTPSSVLYVSFGSLVQTSKRNIEEIAYGLLLSEVKFIWVVRAGMAEDEEATVLPDGYEDEIQDKGLIVPWCNQLRVLEDPAVGGFLTHCGWNSVLESMWFGVPMICYPVDYDQPTNRKLVIDDWQIGINLCDGTSLERKEIADKIRFLMDRSVSKDINENATSVKEKMRSAVEIDGSSERNFNQFIRDLRAKIDSTGTTK